MHLVDALAKMQLTASNKAATCVPFSAYNVKMTLLKGPDALAARRAVASKLDHRAIAALRRPMHVDKPNWTLMQQLSDAGIGVCPTSGMPVLDPAAGAPGLRTAIWRAYCGVASSVNTKQMGQTDEALDELQMRLHEHAAQLRAGTHTALLQFDGVQCGASVYLDGKFLGSHASASSSKEKGVTYSMTSLPMSTTLPGMFATIQWM